MIDIAFAIETFKKYISNYDLGNDSIKLKVTHTYGVMKESEYICNSLNLDGEDRDIALVIALLHDIGRFEQEKVYGTYVDCKSMDHAEYGVKILFEQNMIRKYIKENVHDNIIRKAILNHNRYEIDVKDMSEREILHSKIIRDADKTDNFRVKLTEDTRAILKADNIGSEEISNNIYNDFMEGKIIRTNERKTHMDMWVSYIAFIFDYNFKCSLENVKENNYIDKMIARIKYTNVDTKNKMEDIRKVANNYLEFRIKNR